MFEPIFPGMDPFIEGQRWSDFHVAMMSRIRDYLARYVVPAYQVFTEAYIHLTRPDVSIFRRGKPDSEPFDRPSIGIAEATRFMTPTIYEVDESNHIEIWDEDGKLVTVIEVLSPANKTDHYGRYLAKRDAILNSAVHLVELDLLRFGKRMESDFPSEGYVILVARAQSDAAHRGEVYEVGIRDLLPVIPIPLKRGDEDVALDLPTLFKQLYTDARYRYQLDYTRWPRMAVEDRAWAETLLKASG